MDQTRSLEVSSEKVVLSAFQELESKGLGFVIIGRNGKPTRFRWNKDHGPRSGILGQVGDFLNYTLKEVPKLAIQGSVRLTNLLAVSSLKYGLNAIIEVPVSLPKSDLQKIAALVIFIIHRSLSSADLRSI